MGCFESKLVFEVDESVEGQDSAAKDIFTELLGLSDGEISQIYGAFRLLDRENTGKVRIEQICNTYGQKDNSLDRNIFSLFDFDKSENLNFMEFLCTLWHFLTLPANNVGEVAFLIYEPNIKTTLNLDSVKKLLEMVHRIKIIDDNAGLTLAVQELKASAKFTGAITFKDYVAWTIEYQFLVEPIFSIQNAYHTNMFGHKFWIPLIERRKTHPKRHRFDFFRDLQETVKAKTRAFRAQVTNDQLQNQLDERRGRVHQRRESLLLRAFNVVQPKHKKVAPRQPQQQECAKKKASGNQATKEAASSGSGIIKEQKSSKSAVTAFSDGELDEFGIKEQMELQLQAQAMSSAATTSKSQKQSAGNGTTNSKKGVQQRHN